MPHLDDMPQVMAVERARQQFQKAAEVGLLEFLERRELPEQWAELGPSSVTPESRNRLIELPASLSTRRLVTKREPFSENTKPSGTSLAHLR